MPDIPSKQHKEIWDAECYCQHSPLRWQYNLRVVADLFHLLDCFGDFDQTLMSFFLFLSGQEAKVEELADAILARRIANNIEQKEVTKWHSFLAAIDFARWICCSRALQYAHFNFKMTIFQESAELLPEVMDKPLSLLKMGFNKEEVSSVIAIFGR